MSGGLEYSWAAIISKLAKGGEGLLAHPSQLNYVGEYFSRNKSVAGLVEAFRILAPIEAARERGRHVALISSPVIARSPEHRENPESDCRQR